jgi:exonuclease VII small subunit
VRRLDSGEATLSETLALCREAERLLTCCAAELDAVSAGLAELDLDSLVSRLTDRHAAAPTGRAA